VRPRLGWAAAHCVFALAFALAGVALGGAASLLLTGCASAPSRPLAQEWYELGNSWLDKKEWKKAGEAYAHALAIDPSFAGASYNLARALAAAGDYEGSLRALDSLAKRDPGNVRVAAARAYALYKKGDAVAALAAYRRVLALDPYAPDAVYNIALLELSTGDTASAIADLDRLSVAAPDDGQLFLLLGRARDKHGDSAEALAAFEKAEALGKADAEALGRMGELYEAARRFPEAMDAYAAAVKAEPKLAGAWFSLARLRLVVASDSDRGLDALKSALDAGFSDRKAATALLDEPDLTARDKVLELLKAKGMAE
jgi:tetratricopeptide (TPR) repeat protein